MYLADQSGLLKLIGLPIGSGKSSHPHMLEIYQILLFLLLPLHKSTILQFNKKFLNPFCLKITTLTFCCMQYTDKNVDIQ